MPDGDATLRVRGPTLLVQEPIDLGVGIVRGVGRALAVERVGCIPLGVRVPDAREGDRLEIGTGAERLQQRAPLDLLDFQRDPGLLPLR